ncbi:MAG TPA: BON domain-containing protein [Gemmataceae bacterium]|nr:BON domain-containing protein [Gemmataceae bacterium]
MKTRLMPVLSATVGLWLAHTGSTYAGPQDAPPRLEINPNQTLQAAAPVAANQQLANSVAVNLRQSGQLCHYNVDIRVENGLVELTGHVADQAQREEVLRIVQGVPGVERVRDALVIALAAVTPVQAAQPFVVPEPKPLPKQGESFVPPMPSGMPAEPMPIFQAPPGMGPMGMGGPGGMAQPPLPPYAWPTYAPYNNYSRVATPELYPYQSWPFIGPMYPFPKIPLGWRAIQLKWQDGHWWYGRTATGHDFWRVRYW